MASSKKSSRLPRYLLARLRVLQRPTVWKAAIVPVLALVVASLYWVRPGWLGEAGSDRSLPQSSNKPTPTPVAVPTPSFDPADLDIDTLPNLGTLGLPASRSENASPSPLPTETTAAPGPLPEISPRPSLPGNTVPSASRNPFSPNYSPSLPPAGAIALPPGAVALPQRSPLGRGTTTTGDRTLAPKPDLNPGGGISGASNAATPNPTPHPLESAFQRQAIPSSPQGNASTPLLPGPGQSAAGDRLSPTLPGQPASGSYLPRTSPPLGSTGYTLPSGLQSAPVQPVPVGGGAAPPRLQPVPLQPGSANFEGRGQNGAGATRPQFGNSSFYTAPPPPDAGRESPEPEPPPFSSSGQRNRNGQINTFSNP